MLFVEGEYRKKYMNLDLKRNTIYKYLEGFRIDTSFFEDFINNKIVKTTKERLYMVNKKKRSINYIEKKKNSKRLKVFLDFSKLMRDNKFVFDHSANKVLVDDSKLYLLKDFLKKNYEKKRENHGFLKLNHFTFTLPLKKTYKYYLKLFFIKIYRKFFKRNFNTKGSRTYAVFLFFKRLSLRVVLLQKAFFQIRKGFNFQFLKPWHKPNKINSKIILVLLFLIRVALWVIFLFCLWILFLVSVFVWQFFFIRYRYFTIYETFIGAFNFFPLLIMLVDYVNTTITVYDYIFYKIFLFFIFVLKSLYTFTITIYSFLNSSIFLKKIIFIIIMFIFYLYIRSSVPRYKLVDFQNFYWKYILIYVIAVHIISVIIVSCL